MLLISVIAYLLCGTACLAYWIVKEQSFDLSGGFVSNWIVYPLGLLFWWYWIYQDIKG